MNPARSESGADVFGAVLCGGASSRMGGVDKAALQVGARSLLERAIAALEPVCESVILATGSEPRYTWLGLESVLDAAPGQGPLGGLCASLRHAQSARKTWLVTLACDMPRASSEVLTRLLERARTRNLDACVLETAGGLEPLCGVYSTRCLQPAEEALAAGRRRMIAFHDSARIGTLREEELPRAVHGSATNLNTPEELASERRSA